MRLIDADALVAELKWLQSQVSSTSAMEIAEYIDRTNAQPTIDAVVLPLKPGDIVFYMNRYRRKVWPMKIITVEINSQGIKEYGCWCDVPESYTPICFPPIAIGETVFFTREEAEAALAKMNEGNATTATNKEETK